MLKRRRRAPHFGTTVMLRRGPQASRFGFVMMLRCGLRTPRFGTIVMLRCGLRTPRLDDASMALIILASEVWTLLSDDLSSVIFRQSTLFGYCLDLPYL